MLALGAVAGWRLGPRLAAASQPVGRRHLLRGVAAFAAVILLLNVPVIFAIPQQGSPRVFAPTWLVLAVAAGVGGASTRWRRPHLLGTVGGLFAAGALLSLMFSVSVRLHSADFTARAALPWRRAFRRGAASRYARSGGQWLNPRRAAHLPFTTSSTSGRRSEHCSSTPDTTPRFICLVSYGIARARRSPTSMG